jgi:hypothetical protein
MSILDEKSNSRDLILFENARPIERVWLLLSL